MQPAVMVHSYPSYRLGTYDWVHISIITDYTCEAYQPGTTDWKFGGREIEIEERLKWRRRKDDDAEKTSLLEQKPIAKDRFFPLQAIKRRVSFLSLVVLELMFLTSDKADFLWEALCWAWAWQLDCHRCVGHKHLCQAFERTEQASFLLGGLGIRLGGIVLLSWRCERRSRLFPTSYTVPSTQPVLLQHNYFTQ